MQSMVCGRCGSSWTEPDMFSEELRHEVAALIRANNPIVAMHQIVERSPLGLRDAKAVALHITQEPQRCHHCKRPLEGAPVSLCPSCRALNYDW